jgi:hypothetical protein
VGTEFAHHVSVLQAAGFLNNIPENIGPLQKQYEEAEKQE